MCGVCVWGGGEGGGALPLTTAVRWGGGETAVNYNSVCVGGGGGGGTRATYRQLQQLGDFGSDNDIVIEV